MKREMRQLPPDMAAAIAAFDKPVTMCPAEKRTTRSTIPVAVHRIQNVRF